MCDIPASLSRAEFPSHIVLAVGEERAFPLNSLAMAGYQWTASVSGPEPGAVALEVRRGELSPQTRPGLSAPEELLVRGIEPGRAHIALEQRRPWEQRDKPPAQQIELDVEVRA